MRWIVRVFVALVLCKVALLLTGLAFTALLILLASLCCSGAGQRLLEVVVGILAGLAGAMVVVNLWVLIKARN